MRQILLCTIEHLENDKLKSINSQLKSQCENQRASMIPLEESLLSYTYGADIAEGQAKNLIVQVAELQKQLNSIS